MSRIGAGIGAAVGGLAGSIAGVQAAAAIEGGYEQASRTNEDALFGLLGMFFGGIAGAAIGAGSSSSPKTVGVGHLPSGQVFP